MCELGDSEVDGYYNLEWKPRDHYLGLLSTVFKFFVDNQQLLGGTTFEITFEEVHELGKNTWSGFYYDEEVQDELEMFINALSTRVVKNIHLHVCLTTIGDIAYRIQQAEREETTDTRIDLLIRIRDWWLNNRTVIKADPKWIYWLENKDGKNEWLNYVKVRNKASGKSRNINFRCRDRACDDGDNCSLWK